MSDPPVGSADPAAAGTDVVLCDALEKVFLDERPRARAAEPLSGFLGEVVSFQIAWRTPAVRDADDLPPLHLEVDAGGGARVELFVVGHVPVTVPAFADPDRGYLRTVPGLFPDPLVPLPEGSPLPVVLGAWQSVWVDVVVDSPEHAGARRVRVRLGALGRPDAAPAFSADLEIVVHPVELPPLDITVAHWLHVDCLADRYGCTPFSEQHWRLVAAYLPSLARSGATTVLTPLWTPPLDTAVGLRRTPTQLVDIRLSGDLTDGRWTFGFDALDRWLEECARAGFTSIEIPPLFSQWGARAAPSITAVTDDGPREVFGWHVPSTDPAYTRFLTALLPAVRTHLSRRWPGTTALWHVSDEPGPDSLDTYRAARLAVRDLLDGERVVDALSHRTFLTEGLVDTAVVATDAIAEFLDAGDPVWAYYCNAQDRAVANRFIAQSAVRHRVIGRQLFVADVRGFLHWGFNFWNTQLSRATVDPFRDTTSGGAFPGGDAFVVYPGADGRPVESVRHRVLAQAFADHRALQLLRDLTDRRTACAVVDEDGTLTFDRFSDDPQHHLRTRRLVDERIAEALGGHGLPHGQARPSRSPRTTCAR
ncbi:MAG: DUF4091 domain-containing protein [Actinobacteria bacterium]|nr:DUF4091 domain-containing protein [Actinomycetota bacterium]